MEKPPHQTETGTDDAKWLSGHTVWAIAAVCLVNVAILGYAVSISLPRGHEAAKGKAAVGEVSAPSPVAEVASVPTPSDAVVNPIVLPESGVVRGMYLQHCAACHGVEGRGDGPAAKQLFPGPRDFTGSPFRFVPLAGSQDEVIAALERSIVQGVPHSGMPGFGGVLPDPVIAGLARYVHSLRPPQATMDTPKMQLGARPPTTSGLVERGRQLYTQHGCVSCHGEEGHGDGPNSRTLLDAGGRPILPADLASGLYKSGRTPEDVMRTILQGVPGTPMVGYEAALTRVNADGTRDLTDAWAIAAFLESRRPKVDDPGIASGADIVSRPAADAEMLTHPGHVAWLGIEPVRLALRPLWNREELILSVDVRAAKTAKQLAICLDWRDATRNDKKQLDTFTDAVAVMFTLGSEVPTIPMGVQLKEYTPDAAVNIWHWQAYRQTRTAKRTGKTPAAWDLMLLPDEGVDPQGDGICRAADEPLPSFCTALDADNYYNHPALVRRSVLESNAKGFGTLTLQPPEQQAVQATAAWCDGLWRVVMVRALEPSGMDDADFRKLERMPVSFAVWDGAKGDRDGSKLITGWHWLVLKATTTADAVGEQATMREAVQ